MPFSFSAVSDTYRTSDSSGIFIKQTRCAKFHSINTLWRINVIVMAALAAARYFGQW